MEAAAKQIKIRLDSEHARKLTELAAERHIEETELAGEVLAGARIRSKARKGICPGREPVRREDRESRGELGWW
jgi:hypothetical protein